MPTTSLVNVSHEISNSSSVATAASGLHAANNSNEFYHVGKNVVRPIIDAMGRHPLARGLKQLFSSSNIPNSTVNETSSSTGVSSSSASTDTLSSSISTGVSSSGASTGTNAHSAPIISSTGDSEHHKHQESEAATVFGYIAASIIGSLALSLSCSTVCAGIEHALERGRNAQNQPRTARQPDLEMQRQNQQQARPVHGAYTLRANQPQPRGETHSV